MENLVIMHNGKATTTSKIIADNFEKDHRKVMRDILEIDCSEEFRAANFGLSSYVSPQNKVIKCYDITKDGFMFLCMGFTGKKAAKWKENFVLAFNNLSNKNKIHGSMIALNELSAKIESDKYVASICGRELAKYKQVKKDNEQKFIDEVNQAQFSLGFTSEVK